MNRGRHKNSVNRTFRQLRQEYANTTIRTCLIRLENHGTTIYNSFWINTNVEKVIDRIKTRIHSNMAEQIYI